MPRLTDAEVTRQLQPLTGWSQSGGELTRSFEFPDFATAFAFVTRIALQAEALGHHPDIDIRYNRVRLGLVSHDAGGITDRDIRFAQAVNALAP